ncbi:MAG TPA: hypothetical protein VM121_09025 [Acidimicrobiales bacterium]|nr:hypothetical protein [Acidimicrobiales bacterium]
MAGGQDLGDDVAHAEAPPSTTSTPVRAEKARIWPWMRSTSTPVAMNQEKAATRAAQALEVD